MNHLNKKPVTHALQQVLLQEGMPALGLDNPQAVSQSLG
jgi:hypothetical protein